MLMIEDTVNVAYEYIVSVSEEKDLPLAKSVLAAICQCGEECIKEKKNADLSYEDAQSILSKMNEKESIRRSKGVYYTPVDVVEFIVSNCIKILYGRLAKENITELDMSDIPYIDFCKERKAFDPTCGAGEFLLFALKLKFDIWDKNGKQADRDDIEQIVSTIHGNDVNRESIIITKLRLYLLAVQKYGVQRCRGLANILNSCFTSNDYVLNPSTEEYDIIIGNPPYVEDGKSGLELKEKYGNIYANVLVNAAINMKENGAFGFIIPLSYISTPRMKRLRETLRGFVSSQYILNYSDRPDCLFSSVHQKLSILLCKKGKTDNKVYTGNYRYWYKEERIKLFTNTSVILNRYVSDGYIPKLGNCVDERIYEKVVNNNIGTSLNDYSNGRGTNYAFVNMRAAFWIKAFRKKHKGSEYKQFGFDESRKADYFICIMNSSLFWWFWVCVSDCWHITKKELAVFRVPVIEDYSDVERLAAMLENKLEETKLFVGTVQTDYEYKHKNCTDEIHAIDDYISRLYDLTDEENKYIKEFAYKYRVSGGAINEGD